MKTESKTISIIGVGRLGGALALALSGTGYFVENLFVKDEIDVKSLAKRLPKLPGIHTDADYSQISSSIILIATQDSEIENVAAKLAESLKTSQIVLHTSGSQSSIILKKAANFEAGSIHPVVSISDSISGSEKFKGAYFGIEGDGLAVKAAEQIASDLDGKPFKINTESKALYHASAVMACGHLVALIDTAYEMLTNCGIENVRMQDVLMPLIRSTIDNLEVQSTSQALTGTFARLDSETFERHLNAMNEFVPEEIVELYLQLGKRSVHLVKSNPVNRERREEMLKKISLAKKNLKC